MTAHPTAADDPGPVATARSRYIRDFSIAMGAYVVAIFSVVWILRTQAPEGPLLWALAVTPALPLLRVIQVVARHVLDLDEYQRALQMRRMLAALAVTMGVCTVWGFVEAFADAPHIDLYLVFPLFSGLWGLSCLFIRRAQ